MQKAESILGSFDAHAGQISLVSFALHLLLASACAYLLSRFYARFGQSISNRDLFGRNFALISMTTMLIITLVRSSVALSLGLVGALSIIRFRAAIKEPEELSYLFLAISLGLGFGAEQAAVTVAGFAMILAVLALKYRARPRDDAPNVFLTVTSSHPEKVTLTEILAVFREFGTDAHLKRLDETPKVLEAALRVRFPNTERLEEFNKKLRSRHPSVTLSYLEDAGIGV